MSWRAKRLTDEVKTYDTDLCVKYFNEGDYFAVYRKKNYWVSFSMPDGTLLHSSLRVEDLVLPLTNNWLVTGYSVDWGIEPLMAKLKETDGWRDDTYYQKMLVDRERSAKNSERAKRNEIRAIAADARKDFARATNDINTSCLKKTDKRRNQLWQ